MATMITKRITDTDVVDSLGGNESFFINQNSSIKQINKNNIVFGVANGGTGATTVAGARNALGLGNTSGAVPIANGGTGATTADGAITNLGGVKKSGDTITGTLNVYQLVAQNDSNYPYIHFTNTANKGIGSYGFSHVSEKYRAQVVCQSEDSSYREEYRFPIVDSDRTSNGYYDVLTTKTVTYGDTLPAAGIKGRIFFKKVDS